ncbi:MAG: hypothetical protein V1907_05100 [Candidatus Kerfeldbacteria bacterium]
MKKIVLPVVASAIILFMGVSMLPHSASAASAKPTITTISLTNGAYKATINGKKVTLRPFSGYTGAVWAKKVNFGANLGSMYLFMNKDARTPSELKYYSTGVGSMRSLAPFYGAHYKGYNVDMIVQPKTKKVYIAFGTKATGASAHVREVMYKRTDVVNSPTVAPTESKGVVLVKFLKLYTNEYGLVTMISGNTATLKVWRYSSSTHRFDEDTSYDKTLIHISGDTLTL